jgi:signal recognition particle receptor subunit beta
MASVNPLSRELVFKIVYYGPGLGGKTTTLEHLHATAKPEHRGKLVSLATPVDRTLYFDFLPVRLPPMRGLNIRLQLFTVPGQVYFNATRKLVLTGADGVVFVSDSQIVRADANLESLENLRENLSDQGRDLSAMPLVFQHNKRDLPDLLPLEEMDSLLNPFGADSLGTSATSGEGIYESLERISQRVLASFESKMPEGIEGFDPSFAPIEGGLVTALRQASHSDRPPPSDVVVAKIAAPGAYPSFPPEPAPSDAEADDDAPSHRLMDADPAAATRESAPGLSFAELWPEAEQEMVKEIEAAIQRASFWRSIELCETLVSRILASAAGLFGTTDAPRDPTMVPLLLGLDGRRYLMFRSIVREARAGGLLTARDALAVYAFAIDARLARSSIH